MGILLADTVREYSRTVMLPADARSEDAFAELETAAQEDSSARNWRALPQRSVDLRYRGQGYELNVPYCGPDGCGISRTASARLWISNEEQAGRRL